MHTAGQLQGAQASLGAGEATGTPSVHPGATPRAQRVKIVRRPLHGLLLLDKPLGLSSNNALQKAKWLLRAEKAGHTGTLDPLATGVLPICFGAATKFSQLHLDADKTYVAVARLGVCTTTGDAEGDVTHRQDVPADALRPDALERLRGRFLGPLQQLPPMHSALKKDGKALYEYARDGIVIDRQPRNITIFELDLSDVSAEWGFPALKMRVKCSKGTYIRTLGEDLGSALGCGAHLVSLRRTMTGEFDETRCVTLEALEAMSEAQRQHALLSVDALLAHHTRVTLDSENAGRFLSGVRRRGHWADSPAVAVYGSQPKALLGLGHVMAGELIPDRLLSPLEIQQILESTSVPALAGIKETT